MPESPLGFLYEDCRKRHGDGSAVVITLVKNLTPAAKSGLQINDIVLKANGELIYNSTDLLTASNHSEGGLDLYVHKDGRRKMYCTVEYSKAEQMLRGVYNFYDKDKDGTVTFDEIFEHKQNNVNLDAKEDSAFSKIATSFDTDGDKAISMDEFLSFFHPIEETIPESEIAIVHGRLMPSNAVELYSATNVAQIGQVKRVVRNQLGMSNMDAIPVDEHILSEADLQMHRVGHVIKTHVEGEGEFNLN